MPSITPFAAARLVGSGECGFSGSLLQNLSVQCHARCDSNSGQSLDGYVLRIDPQATFTPENTYFRDDRVKQVVGVKLLLKSGIGYAKPGMPADGEILVSGDTWPAEVRK